MSIVTCAHYDQPVIRSARSWFSGAGRVGLVLGACAAFATFALPWFTSGNDHAIIGLDLVYVRHELPDEAPPLATYFLETAALPAYVAVLLAFTVGVRHRWARFVAVVPVVLATTAAMASAVGLWASIEHYWQPDAVAQYRLFALVTAVPAVLLLIAAGTLAAGLRHVYDGFVVLLLLGFAAFQVIGTTLIARQGVGTTMTAVPWFTVAAYTLAAGCAMVAAIASPGPAPKPAAPGIGDPAVPLGRG